MRNKYFSAQMRKKFGCTKKTADEKKFCLKTWKHHKYHRKSALELYDQ